jgi:hypothetical protein
LQIAKAINKGTFDARRSIPFDIYRQQFHAIPEHASRHTVSDDQAHPRVRYAGYVTAVDFVTAIQALTLHGIEKGSVYFEVDIEAFAESIETQRSGGGTRLLLVGGRRVRHPKLHKRLLVNDPYAVIRLRGRQQRYHADEHRRNSQHVGSHPST